MKAYLNSLLLAVLSATAAIPTELHVATTGADTNPGTRAQPFATFPRAQVDVRAERVAHPDQGVTVTILGGFYRLENRRAVWTRLIRNIPHR
jgi:hypothetical protein